MHISIYTEFKNRKTIYGIKNQNNGCFEERLSILSYAYFLFIDLYMWNDLRWYKFSLAIEPLYIDKLFFSV